MVFDHIAKIYLEVPHFLEVLGRVVFPIFCYIMVYNYLHRTSNKLKYLSKLFAFALISQPIFTYVFSTPTSFLNILFTLFGGLLFIYAYEKIEDYKKHANQSRKKLATILSVFFGILVFITLGGYVSYYWFGLILIFGFYYYLTNPSQVNLFALVISVFCVNTFSFGILQMIAGLGFFAVVYLVSLTKLEMKRFPGIAFYLFYPLHLIALKIPTI